MALEATQFTGGTPGIIGSIASEIASLGGGLEDLAEYSNYATLNTFLQDLAAVKGANVINININIDFANDEIIGKVISLNKPSEQKSEKPISKSKLVNQKVALQAANDNYICAEGGGGQSVVENRSAVGSWETFTRCIGC
ncbi:MAG: hypothetical protein DCF25_19935 [Leptolyngbya foveolarum]|uniref:Uncharacterized protein n=1 Tax=Leptolyngbya foveolarum TaxID=47253 RepID=A0A2W4TWS3_9CYAN|nr:MAG: hypothetical protein DCF25_19935 [Leptolyngbya foveolarum]